MSEQFDPYRKWLGIPPEDQPPHHYRLLGVGLFEDDPDVIEAAADRQMAHVQTYKTGKHSALSQRILNELAAAKLCLLQKKKKSDYDEQLRARLLSTRMPPPPPPVSLGLQSSVSSEGPAPMAASEDDASGTPAIEFAAPRIADVSLQSSRGYVRQRKQAQRAQWVVLGIVLLAIAGGGFWFWQKFRETPSADQKPDPTTPTTTPVASDATMPGSNAPDKPTPDNPSVVVDTPKPVEHPVRPTPAPNRNDPRLMRTLEGHAGPVYAVALSQDSGTLISASADHTLRVWSVADKSRSQELVGHTAPVRTVAISPDGRQALSAGDDRTLRLWDLLAGKEEKQIATKANHVNCVAYTPGGLKAWSAGDDGAVLWDLYSGMEISRQGGFSAPLLSVSVGGDAGMVAAASADGVLRIWSDSSEAPNVFEFRHPQKIACSCLAFSPNGKYLAAGYHDRTVRLYDLANRAEAAPIYGHKAPVCALAFSAEGDWLVTGSGASEDPAPASNDLTIRMWDVESRQELGQGTGHTAAINAVAIDSQARFVISGSDDSTIRIWRLPSTRRNGQDQPLIDEPSPDTDGEGQ